MAAAGPEDWTSLRRRARMAEARVEQALRAYEALPPVTGSSGSLPPDVDEKEKEAASWAAAQVEDFRHIYEALRQHPEAGSAANARFLSRTGSALTSLTQRQQSLHAAYERRRERDSLFTSRRAGAGDAQDLHAAMAGERSHLTGTNREMDELLKGMDATSSRLADDNASLERSRSTTERYLAKLPVVGDLIGSIRDRRKRSQLILAAVIAAVVCFFLWFLVLRHMPSSSTPAEE
ncbi:hypothetical protein FNF29_07284 [Cafeteria roenbergensis]|uniref:Uncharacterized protein n=1 Tax=Cafeteria roenbergensis TaxID=33653 RepID=A0A5A8E4N9_CAFRO|nr:hypothetical protein FNF29_07284 [Cafeteria roenbergensis]KAA0167485.1 hypothetical protein FNF31_00924 [Cafeteria roenbergensis]KAA0172399.1 hypothetical protein FNF28_00082 [Cafeteria roenbergensis]|eukprot:KAA0147539.1 hypothetical protein FNF29_07284 [Cafeteria roenbergensis]